MTKILKYLALAVLCTFVGATATSVAAQTGPGYAALVGSGLIKNNSVRSVDVKNGTLKKRDLNKKLYDRLLNDDSTTDNDNVVVNAPKGEKGDTGATGAPGPQGPAGTPGTAGTVVRNLSGDFAGTNASVTATLDGVAFGVYDDAGTGGSLQYNGANGLKLNQITQLGYVVKHSSSDDSPISAPYLRIFLEGDSHDVIFDATKCATVVPDEDVFNSYEVTAGDVRYDDDSCDGVAPDQQAWAAVVTAHGNEVVSGIYVTQGFAGGQDLSAILRSLSVNGTTYTFGA